MQNSCQLSLRQCYLARFAPMAQPDRTRLPNDQFNESFVAACARKERSAERPDFSRSNWSAVHTTYIQLMLRSLRAFLHSSRAFDRNHRLQFDRKQVGLLRGTTGAVWPAALDVVDFSQVKFRPAYWLEVQGNRETAHNHDWGTDFWDTPAEINKILLVKHILNLQVSGTRVQP